MAQTIKLAASEIDHHPGFLSSPETPSYFAIVEDTPTGEALGQHIHLTINELVSLLKTELSAGHTLTVGLD